MDSRREFIKKAGILAGGLGLVNGLPASVQRALAIDPAAGSSYLDAEHVVILMQENRSFDHCFGTLRGVRGFNDPRAMIQPDGNQVWLQKNAAGEAYLPFRLNIKESKATWMGSLPHSRASQVDARNDGRHDKWLIAKAPDNKAYGNAPLTMGYYNREDLPFYYALADAFTVCDQNFCSSLTGTTPNRLYLWTGSVRGVKDANVLANLTNADVNYDSEAGWTTFPERLEDNDISWKVYQNELGLESGFDADEEAWLSNFEDNPLEWFKQYHVRFSRGYRNYLQKMLAVLPEQINGLERATKESAPGSAEYEKAAQELKKKKVLLEQIRVAKDIWTEENFRKLSEREQSLHKRAFTTNRNDPFYHELETLRYMDGDAEHTVKLPKGDVLHQFREDVQQGKLPAVSWLVAPKNFSDHPDAPWYGAWYVSEAMDVLTHNPDVWKKTIFILCYDENDGYFDHVPPFVAHDPNKTGTGLASAGLDTSLENVTAKNDQLRPREGARTGAIGLGFRVPLIVASPWSRGGAVCSQVFDHTSIIQLMEKIFSHKTGKSIVEENITSWRRAVCGDLSAVFQAYDNEGSPLKFFLEQHKVIEAIHKAKFKKDPYGYRELTGEEIEQINLRPAASLLMPRQEQGIRPARPVAYELYADGKMNAERTAFGIQFEAGNEIFGPASAGCPFIVYARSRHTVLTAGKGSSYEAGRTWNYAVAAGSKIRDLWPVNRFEKNSYHLALHGPNGFFREFMGNANDPDILTKLTYERQADKKTLTGNILLTVINNSRRSYEILIKDNSYKTGDIRAVSGAAGSAGSKTIVTVHARKAFGWYDFTITIQGNSLFKKQYAGHVETGSMGVTDPAMGDVIG